MRVIQKYKNIIIFLLLLLLLAAGGIVLAGMYHNSQVENTTEIFDLYAVSENSRQEVYVMESGEKRKVTMEEVQNGFLKGKTFYVRFIPEKVLENGTLDIPLGQAASVIFKGEEILYQNRETENAALNQVEFQQEVQPGGTGYYVLRLELGEYQGEAITMALRFPDDAQVYIPGVTYHEALSDQEMAISSAFPAIQEITLLAAGAIFFGILLVAIVVLYKRLHFSIFFFLFYLLLTAYYGGYLIFHNNMDAVADTLVNKVLLLKPVSLILSMLCLIWERRKKISSKWINIPTGLSVLCLLGSIAAGALSLTKYGNLYSYGYSYYILQICAILILLMIFAGVRKSIYSCAVPILLISGAAVLLGILTCVFFTMNPARSTEMKWILQGIFPGFSVSLHTYVIIWSSAAMFLGILTDFIYQIYRTAEEYSTAELLLENSRDELQRIQENIRQTAMVRHDMAKHLETLNYYLREHDGEKAQKYLNSIIELPRKGKEYVHTPNFLLNALLNSRMARAEEQKTVFHVSRLEVPEQLHIEDKDIGCVLLNLLDNALKSCAMQPEGQQREIWLTIFMRHRFLYISIKNTKSPNYRRTKDVPHYGLQIVRQIAEQYEGSLRIKQEDERYEAEVLMKQTDTAEKS